MDCEQFDDIAYEEDVLSITDIKTEPQDIQNELKAEAEECDIKYSVQPIADVEPSIKTISEVWMKTEVAVGIIDNKDGYGGGEREEIEEVEVTQSSSSDFLEDDKKKSHDVVLDPHESDLHQFKYVCIYDIVGKKTNTSSVCNKQNNLSLSKQHDSSNICNKSLFNITNTECCTHSSENNFMGDFSKKLLPQQSDVASAHKSDICNMSFCDGSNLKTHKHIHTSKIPFICDVCKKSFPYKSRLLKHIRVHEQQFVCDFCMNSFSDKYNLLQHIRRSHKNEKPFMCDVCKKSFPFKSGLLKHMNTHEKPFICDLCKKSFSDKCNMLQHVRVHEKPFICDVCQKSFSHIFNLLKHKRVHTNEKPVTCTLCHKSFSNKASLFRHTLIHKNLKPFTCNRCNKSFSVKYNLTRHNILVHANEKSFSQKCHQSEHTRSHSKQKP